MKKRKYENMQLSPIWEKENIKMTNQQFRMMLDPGGIARK
jgi:hypothetical protein